MLTPKLQGTPVTPDFGDCGCDNCKGAFEDISTRMDEFVDRRFIQGWEHSKSIWTVPQGFGAAEYWSRVPTGPEFVVENALAINHGARGSVSTCAGVSVVPAIVLPCHGRKKITRPSLVAGSSRPIVRGE